MNNELKQKLEVIITPILLLEKLPITDYGVAFVAWGVYNKIGQEVSEDILRVTSEKFVQDHRFCIKILEQLIASAEMGDINSFTIFATEMSQHPECMKIVNQMFPKGKF
jgi:hypothetical protein